MHRKRRLIITLGVLAVAAVTAGVVYAAWGVSGSGTGAGAASIAASLTVTPETPSGAGASLYPGGPAGAVFFEITNPNPYPVDITTVSWGTPSSTNPTACASSMISVDANAPTSVNITVPANSTTSDTQINGVLDLSGSASSGCQGNGFSVPMTITGVQT